jgi:hypothetical protein
MLRLSGESATLYGIREKRTVADPDVPQDESHAHH